MPARARASGRPVFLYFTADWCLTCKVNEEVAIERAEIDQVVAQILLELPGEPADLLGAPVYAVQRLRQLAVADHCGLDVFLEQARDLVEGEQVRRIGHAHQHLRAALLERDRAKAARRRLRQPQHDIGLEVVMLEIEESEVELARERPGNLLLGRESHFDEDPAEAPPGPLLLVERQLELLLRHDLLRDENVPQPQALGSARGAHRSGSRTRGGHGDGQLSLFPLGLQVG